MAVVPVRWNVKQILEAHGLSTYRLWKASGLAMGTAYRLARGDTTSLNAETLDRVMTALRDLTGRNFDVGDLISYEAPSVYLAHHDRDVAAAVGSVVRRVHPEVQLTAIRELGLQRATSSEFDAWVKAGVAFSTEAEAEAFVASDDGRAEYFVHAVAPSDLHAAWRDVGVLVDGSPA